MDLRLRVLMFWILLLMAVSSSLGLKCYKCGGGSDTMGAPPPPPCDVKEELSDCSKDKQKYETPLCVAFLPNGKMDFKGCMNKEEHVPKTGECVSGVGTTHQSCFCYTDGCNKGSTYKEVEETIKKSKSAKSGSARSITISMWTGAALLSFSIASWINLGSAMSA